MFWQLKKALRDTLMRALRQSSQSDCEIRSNGGKYYHKQLTTDESKLQIYFSQPIIFMWIASFYSSSIPHGLKEQAVPAFLSRSTVFLLNFFFDCSKFQLRLKESFSFSVLSAHKQMLLLKMSFWNFLSIAKKIIFSFYYREIILCSALYFKQREKWHKQFIVTKILISNIQDLRKPTFKLCKQKVIRLCEKSWVMIHDRFCQNTIEIGIFLWLKAFP